MEIAKKDKVFILAGSVYEMVEDCPKVYNTAVLINGKGEVVGKYRKIHLFNALIGSTSINESDYFLAGDEPGLFEVQGFKVGISTYYDLRFPDLYCQHAKMGADILCVPSFFARVTGMAHWEILLRARAIENLCYVIASNQVGVDGNGVESYGNSMVESPWGEIVSRGSGDKEQIISARKKLPNISGN